MPDSEVYQELKNIVFNNNQKEDITAEIETLKKEYEKNEKEIRDLAQKVKYIDISVINIINQELIKAQNKKEEILNQIQILEYSKNNNKNTKLNREEKYILNIIENCFDIFGTLDLRSKKDIVNLLIESAYGEGDIIEINLLNTKITEKQKRYIVLSSEKGCRQSNDSNIGRSK